MNIHGWAHDHRRVIISIILNGPTGWQRRHSLMGPQPSPNNDIDDREWAHRVAMSTFACGPTAVAE